MKTILKTLLALLACGAALNAAVIEEGKSVAVMPLTITYQVAQSFKADYVKAESKLKGFAKEDSASSYSNTREGDRFFTDSQRSNSRKLDGNYDLHGKDETTRYSYNDMNITERKLDTEAYTGIIESALSEAGIEVSNRDAVNTEATATDIPQVTITTDENSTVQPKVAENPKPQAQGSDYILTGQLNSARLDGIRKVPDGTNTRYSVKGTVKISVKITNAGSGKSKFARTFTGVGTNTFYAGDAIPSAEVMDMAMDDVAAQLTTALTGKKKPNPSESDDEYKDSPGKRLRD